MLHFSGLVEGELQQKFCYRCGRNYRVRRARIQRSRRLNAISRGVAPRWYRTRFRRFLQRFSFKRSSTLSRKQILRFAQDDNVVEWDDYT